MKKLTFIFMLMITAGAVGLFAANPLETMKSAFNTQLTDSVLPVLIFYIMVFGAVISFIMKVWMPLIMAIVLSVVLAMSPSLSSSFVSFGTSFATPTTP